MYMALMDILIPWRKSRYFSFLKNNAKNFNIMTTTGAGFVMGKLGFLKNRVDSFFNTEKTVEHCKLPDIPPIGIPFFDE